MTVLSGSLSPATIVTYPFGLDGMRVRSQSTCLNHSVLPQSLRIPLAVPKIPLDISSATGAAKSAILWRTAAIIPPTQTVDYSHSSSSRFSDTPREAGHPKVKVKNPAKNEICINAPEDRYGDMGDNTAAPTVPLKDTARTLAPIDWSIIPSAPKTPLQYE